MIVAMGTFGSAQAEVTLSEHTSTNLTAMILADSAEIGTQTNLYMGATLNGNWFIRHGASTQNWQPYTGGAIPAALENVALTADPLIVQVVDFDISSLVNAGLEVHVGYGKTPADIFATTGHFGTIISKQTSSPNPNTNNNPPTSSPTSACDTTTAPEGISYTQNGNNITVTTNGKCIVPPKAGMCNAPAPRTATNISMLQTMNVTTFEMSGIKVNMPGMPNPFEQMGKALTGAKTCLKNVPENYSTFTIDADVCYDITESTNSIPNVGGFITVTPPVTEKFKGTIINTSVTDCFTSGADSISDVLTKETWIKQTDGSYLKVK
jgi:hypothetical protein